MAKVVNFLTTIGKRLGNRRISARLLAVLLCVTALLSITPLLVAARDNRPYYDDFASGGQLTRSVWSQTHSVPALLSAAWNGAKRSYLTWEGNYTTNYLNCIQLSALSSRLTPVVTWLLLLSLVGGLCSFCHTLLRYALDGKREACWMAAGVLTLLCAQLIPSVSEAFFWQSGGVKYTLGHALLLWTAALMVRLSWAPPRSRIARIALTGLMCAGALLTAGSNLMTGMALCVGAVLYVGWRWRDGGRIRFAAALCAVFAIAGYAVNVLAPGNGVREGVAQLTGPFSAVVKSVTATAEYVGRWTTLPLLCLLLLITPFLYETVSQSRFSFRHPVWMAVCCFGVLASQLTPPIYVGAYYDDGRLLNTQYLMFVAAAFVSWVYVLGWLSRRSKLPSWQSHGVLLALALTLAVGACVGVLGYGVKKTAGGGAAYAVLTGQTRRYAERYDQRTLLLESDDPSVAVSPIPDIPLIFMKEEYSWDAMVGLLGEYYQKDVHSVAEPE